MAKRKYFNMNDHYYKTLNQIRNKYYNLFVAQFKWTGLTYRQEDYLMRRFYNDGTVAAFKIELIDELGFAPWALQSWDIYDLPETVRLINNKASKLIPIRNMVVDRDVVIGYIQPNRRAVMSVAEWYFERLAQVEMVINTNLQLNKIPYLIPIEDGAKSIIDDVVGRILNNELVIGVEGVDPQLFKAVSTGAPYIIDKLTEYRASLENELKTYLGVNNSGHVQKQEQVNIDELNANNDEINDSQNQFLRCLQAFCKQVKEVLKIDISVEATSAPVVSVGEHHDINEDNKPGPNKDKGGAE